MTRTALVLAMVVAALAFTGARASAHSEMDTSDPAPSAVLDTAPATVTLTFNQRIEQSFATVSVMGGPANEQWTQGEVSVDGHQVRTALRPGMPAGQFTVGYRVVSADGHPITGSYGFTVTVASTPLENTVPGAAPASPSAPADTVNAKTEGEDDNDFPMLGAFIVAAILVAGGLFAVFRGARPGRGGPR
ncbi:copper resistance CopC family protein [Nocardia farcinica]|uniref:copper resistance CopC family protein n=1 Tax=Nocardia farcinica TaxID=37329 RepID=UPI002455FC30|nr:copper resistance protein CopC [Nocardia farcinica]